MQTTSPGSDPIDARHSLREDPRGKGQGREPVLLQDLRQHGGHDLIGTVMGRKADYPVVRMVPVSAAAMVSAG